MRLSVIIPCMKRDEKVERAIRSIGAERSDLEVEPVVVEGLRPVGRARNEGLARATGDYISWIDGDDEVTADWLPTVGAAIAARPGVDVLVLGMRPVGWTGRRDFVWAPQGEPTPRRLLIDLYRNLGMAGNQVLFVTRRELWNGLRFDEDVVVGEDYLMAPRVLSRARSCQNLGKALYLYYRNAGSLMTEQAADKERDLLRIQERRLAEAPAECRRAVLWGIGVDCYWWAERGALSGRETELSRHGRKWLRRHLPVLTAEALCGRGLCLRDRIGWMVRFFCAVTGCWWWQRRKRAGKGEGT